MEYCNIASAARFDLFDCETWTESTTRPPKDKPRQASSAELKAYMRWLADKAGLHAFEEMKLSSNGATFGDCDSASTYDPATRAYTVPVYQKGAYSIPLPGRNSHHDKVTLETLDESGAVVASQTLPREPKKLGVIWDKAAVHKAVGPIAKPVNRRMTKRDKIDAAFDAQIAKLKAQEALASAPPIVPNDQAPDPVAPVKVKLRLVAVASDAPPIVEKSEPAPEFTISQARYSKGQLAVHCRTDGTGYKTRAMRLIADGLGARWTGREKSYICSIGTAARFERLYAAGFDACVMSRGNLWHSERKIDAIGWRDAEKLALQWAIDDRACNSEKPMHQIDRLHAIANPESESPAPIVANPPHVTPSPLNEAPSAVNGVAEAIEAAIVSQCGDVATEAIDSGRMEIVTIGFGGGDRECPDTETPETECPDRETDALPVDTIAELVARIAEIERELEIHRNLIIDANPLPEDVPAVETAIDTPIIAKPKRSPAHVRAIMAYLRMRKERVGDQTEMRYYQQQRDEARALLAISNGYVATKEMQIAARDIEIRRLKAKRRRAVLFARDLQKRLNSEHRLVDKLTAAKREMAGDMCVLKDELAAAKRSISAVEKTKTHELDQAIGRQMVAERLAELRARNLRVA